MKILPNRLSGCLIVGILFFATSLTQADDDVAGFTPLYNGGFVAPMGTVTLSQGSSALGTGLGGTLAAGFRKDFYAIEGRGYLSIVSVNSGSDAHLYGGTIDGLLFPFFTSMAPRMNQESLVGRLFKNTYLLIGAGAQDTKSYPGNSGSSVGTTIYQGGIGDLVPFRFGRYEFALRVETLYQGGSRDRDSKDVAAGAPDVNVPRTFNSVIFNVGLQLPMGLTHEQPEQAPPPPPAVVPVSQAPDSDGDGVADDVDQCPNTPKGVQVDDKGCPLPPAPPPPPPCKAPATGERVSLAGCGTGDTITLHGVNFESNKAKMTPNATSIMDNVADELNTYAAIHVEIDGHTDGKGSELYNKKLSERRADAVRNYLLTKGISGDRLTTAGFGASQPIASNDTDDGREQNRRVVLKIVGGAAAAEAPVAPDQPAAPAALEPVTPPQPASSSGN